MQTWNVKKWLHSDGRRLHFLKISRSEYYEAEWKWECRVVLFLRSIGRCIFPWTRFLPQLRRRKGDGEVFEHNPRTQRKTKSFPFCSERGTIGKISPGLKSESEDGVRWGNCNSSRQIEAKGTELWKLHMCWGLSYIRLGPWNQRYVKIVFTKRRYMSYILIIIKDRNPIVIFGNIY